MLVALLLLWELDIMEVILGIIIGIAFCAYWPTVPLKLKGIIDYFMKKDDKNAKK